MSSAITTGLSAATAAVGSFVGKFSAASNTELERIGMAGDLARATGMSFGDSQKDIAAFNKRMNALAKDLPGTSQMFADIGLSLSDNLALGFKDASGALDLEGFREAREEFAKFGAMRTQFSGVELADTNLFISKLLDGRSLAELKTLKFAEANVGVVAELERILAKNGQEIKDLGKRELINLAQQAISVEDAVVDAAKNSTAGIMASFSDTLFNAEGGIFGIMKDLDTSVNGNQSVYSSMSRVIKKIFGGSGVIASAARIFTNITGIDSNGPMQLLADGIGRVGAWVDGLNRYLSGIVNMSDDSRGFNIGSFLSDIPSKIGAWLARQVNTIFTTVASVDAAVAGPVIGQALASGINAVANYIANIDVMAVGAAFLNVAMTAANAAVFAVRNLNFSAVGQTLLTVALGSALAMGASATAGFLGLSAAASAAIVGVAAGVTAAIQGIGASAAGWAGQISGAISGLFGQVAAQIRSAVSSIPFIGGGGGGGDVKNKASGLDQLGIFDAIAREQSAMPTGAQPVIANDSELIMNRSQQAGLLGALGSRGGGGSSVVMNNTININGSNLDAQQLSQQILKEIGRQWQQFDQSKLAPNY